MLGRFGMDAGSLLGIEIALPSIRLVQLHRHKGAWCVRAWALEPLPAGAVVDGWIADPEVVGQALKRALQRSGSRCRQGAVALPATRAISKLLTLPAGLGDAEVAARVHDAAEQFIPFDLEDTALDYQVLEPVAGDASSVQVAITACHRGMLDVLEATFEVAGLSARVLEIDTHAVQRATTGEAAVLQLDAELAHVASNLRVACGLAMWECGLNLLPWRERRHRLRIRRFQAGCAAVVLLAAVTTGFVDLHYRGVLQEQALSLATLKREGGQPEPEALLHELRQLEGLQAGRFFAVDVLEHIEQAMPDGLYLTALSQELTALKLTGMAQSAALVAQLAGNLSSSPLISSAELQQISAVEEGHAFELAAALKVAP
ncbi:pilus assembly protein PilM [Pseudomonas sp. RC2C2]|uniref:pilus assembly protein PilM n=1 Tax=Pseudomonas sp. RC2C2 TaxID=2834408 RepID=UPI001BCD3AD1|nr:pilus assembly protein PilM [Pseudomonas sp. RC2C2]MBS7598894.1 pilus assembly protein PilM [Pseudomonas sp. RC2C2]